MNELLFLFDKYGCDKGTKKHRYDKIYLQHFEPLRDKPLNILEVGVFRGESTLALLDYFPKATVVGVDIYERVELADLQHVTNNNRFVPVKGSSLNSSTVKQMPDGFKFDIIIDDGAHYPEANRLTFNNFFPMLKDDGKYFIEDVWPLENDNARNHVWVQNRPTLYSDEQHQLFMETIEQHKLTVYNQNNPKHPDSTIYMVEK